ncbi:hypothetical protein OPT61_g1572 [Boeremia exigua]|uniref:Uncharacterized protein n=1 Tax=Boeremia exigua TaxID=749465 RepID=A0ACC2IPV4_9PLEO|nr:hypothetical protein OPT61_g1572 [Boeremia exigua]
MATPARYRKPAGTAETASTSTASHEDTVPIPRAPASTAEAKKELKAAVQDQASKTSNGLSILDILRVLGGLALLSAGMSYLSTSGESMTWGYNGKWTRMQEWKNLVVGLHCPHAGSYCSTMAATRRSPSTSPSTAPSTTSPARRRPTDQAEDDEGGKVGRDGGGDGEDGEHGEGDHHDEFAAVRLGQRAPDPVLVRQCC